MRENIMCNIKHLNNYIVLLLQYPDKILHYGDGGSFGHSAWSKQNGQG